MNGRIFDIQRFSVHDGPGVRTTVFLKGCPLRCRWCHNPEGLSSKIQLKYTGTKCIGCMKCVSVCKNHFVDRDGEHGIDFKSCTACKKCVEGCPTGALELCGEDVTPYKVLDAILLDKAFYRENGGATFSGGECLIQSDFVLECLRLCKENGISTAVDTCGYVKWEAIERVIPYTDIFLYDIKAFDSATHEKYTGCKNELIIDNLKRLSSSGARIWIRIPVIPGVNDSDSEMHSISELIGSLPGIERVTLMPYHAFGGGKYQSIGLTYDFDTKIRVPKEKLSEFKALLKSKGLNAD